MILRLRIHAALLALALPLGCGKNGEGPDPEREAMQDSGGRARGDPLVRDAELASTLPELEELARFVRNGATDKRLLRAYWRLRPRAFPDLPEPLPEDYLIKVRDWRDELNPKIVLEVRSSWQAFGASDLPGRMTDIVQHPQDPNRLWAGSASGGVWQTQDGGLKWSPQAQHEPSLAIGAIAIDPQRPDRLYAGTGEGNFVADNIFGTGILVTDDGGQSWRVVRTFLTRGLGPARFPRHFHRIVVDPADPRRVWAATDTGLFVSNPDQTAWTRVPELPAVRVTSILLPVSGDARLYAALHDPADPAVSGLWAITPPGAATRVEGFGDDTRRIDLARSPTAPGRLYAAVSTAPNAQGQSFFAGIWRRPDAASQWSRLASSDALGSPCNDYCDYCLTIAAAGGGENGRDTLFVGAIAPYVSRDGGTTWTSLPDATGDPVPPPPFRDIHRFLVATSQAGAMLWAATDGGIWRFDAAAPAEGWKARNGDLRTTQLYHLSADPRSPDHVLAAAQDRGMFVARRAAGSELLADFDGVCTDADERTDGLYFAAERATGIFRFEQRAKPAIPIVRGLGEAKTATRRAYFVVDRRAPGLLVGTTRVWQSLDVPATGNATDVFEMSAELGSSGVISGIAQSPVDPATIWAGLDDGRVFFTDASLAGNPLPTRWRDVTGNLPNRAVSSLVAHPTDRTKAWVTFALAAWNQAADPEGNVWVADDAQGSWRDISRAGSRRLPPVAVNHLQALSADGHILALATDTGVFWSKSPGCWYALMDGLPNVAVSWLAWDPVRRLLRAATYGRGLWELRDPRLGELLPPCL